MLPPSTHYALQTPGKKNIYRNSNLKHQAQIEELKPLKQAKQITNVGILKDNKPDQQP
jgi:hypothetical protein